MASDVIFEMEWKGLEKLSREFDVMDERIDRIIKEEMTKFGLLAEEGTKALVHHDEGTLEDSINFDEAKKEGKWFIVRGGSNVEYALRRHEEPGIGPGTARKPSWRGYKPGPKYLENAVKAIEKDYDKMNERILERILGEEL